MTTTRIADASEALAGALAAPPEPRLDVVAVADGAVAGRHGGEVPSIGWWNEPRPIPGISKTFLAAAAVGLELDGMIDLDAPLGRTESDAELPVTGAQRLRHTSGSIVGPSERRHRIAPPGALHSYSTRDFAAAIDAVRTLVGSTDFDAAVAATGLLVPTAPADDLVNCAQATPAGLAQLLQLLVDDTSGHHLQQRLLCDMVEGEGPFDAGMGIYRRDVAGVPWLQHGGVSAAGVSLLVAMPTLGVGFALLVQGADDGVRGASCLAAMDLLGLTPASLPSVAPPPDLDRWLGTYVDADRVICLGREGDATVLKVSGCRRWRGAVRFWAPDRFLVVDGWAAGIGGRLVRGYQERLIQLECRIAFMADKEG